MYLEISKILIGKNYFNFLLIGNLMELAFLHHATGSNPLLQLSVVTNRQRKQVLPLILLLVPNSLDFLLDNQTQPGQNREEIDDPNQYDQSVPDLNVVFGVQQHDHGLG